MEGNDLPKYSDSGHRYRGITNENLKNKAYVMLMKKPVDNEDDEITQKKKTTKHESLPWFYYLQARNEVGVLEKCRLNAFYFAWTIKFTLGFRFSTHH